VAAISSRQASTLSRSITLRQSRLAQLVDRAQQTRR
jgi:hypothetical protein